jgi:hypothetical protein
MYQPNLNILFPAAIPMFWSILWPLAIYWLILFVCCYVILEFGQNYLYDEVTSAAPWKLAAGTLVLAGALMYTRTRLDTMFTSDLGFTVLQAILWFGVFTLIFRFQPLHGGVIGIVAMCILTALSTMAVDSMSTSTQVSVPQRRAVSTPPRRPSVYVPPAAEKKDAAAK